MKNVIPQVIAHVWARYKTSSKVIIPVTANFYIHRLDNIPRFLSDKYGGDWVLVDNVYENEIVVLDDSDVYLGFDANTSRYTSSLVSVQKQTAFNINELE